MAVDEEEARGVRRIFEFYAYQHHTLDSLSEVLDAEGLTYTASKPRFTRSKLYSMLQDRSCLGEVYYRGQWYPGKQPPLIDQTTFNCVNTLLGQKTYNAHESVYGSGMVVCGRCGRPVVVEVKVKNTKAGPHEYRYYRCARYNEQGHPRVRAGEWELDKQGLAVFEKMRIQDEKVRQWIVRVLHAKSRSAQDDRKERLEHVK